MAYESQQLPQERLRDIQQKIFVEQQSIRRSQAKGAVASAVGGLGLPLALMATGVGGPMAPMIGGIIGGGIPGVAGAVETARKTERISRLETEAREIQNGGSSSAPRPSYNPQPVN